MLRFKEFRREYPEYMPSSSVKNLWLYTLKKEANIQGATMPGMFQSVNYSLLLAGVLLIFTLEIGATAIAYRFGINLGAIIAAMIVEFGFALCSHFNHSKICETKNLLFIEEKTTNRDKLNRKLNKLKKLQWFTYAAIIILGLFKFSWFYFPYNSRHLIKLGLAFDAYTILVFCCYFFGSVLHIICTGYVLFTSYFHFRIHKEETKYVYLSNNENVDHLLVCKGKTRPITTPVELITATVGRHELCKDHEKNQYYLKTTGVLLDEELRQIIDRQHDYTQKHVLAQECVKIQLDILRA